MKKLLLLSVIIAAIVIPVRASKMKDPREGLRKALVHTALFNLFYIFLLLFVWHRL
jgi:hypothetical protein